MALSPVQVRVPARDTDTRILSEELLTPAAQDFLTRLHREVEPTRRGLLKARQQRWAELRKTGRLTFPKETIDQRASEWRVAEVPPDLQIGRASCRERVYSSV